MTSKTSNQSADSPFEQVRVVEDRESARVEAAKLKYEAATLEKLRTIDDDKSEKAEALHASKTQELKEFASRETTSVIGGAQKDAASDVAGLESHAALQKSAAEAELLKKALDPSFILAA